MLVVGTGPVGQQIADDLVRGGRRVYLSVGRHRRVPRRYRGRDHYSAGGSSTAGSTSGRQQTCRRTSGGAGSPLC